MRPLVLTNDMVLVSFVKHLLDEAGIHHAVWDESMSSVEGSLGFLPRRVMVEEGRWSAAVRLLEDAGLGSEIAGARGKRG